MNGLFRGQRAAASAEPNDVLPFPLAFGLAIQFEGTGFASLAIAAWGDTELLFPDKRMPPSE